jgi:energy-coupling factor transporter ATP-binding protein EcfA2
MEKLARDKLSELGLMTIQNINQAVETLSGGQRQGVAVARAAAFGSKVIILDEPTAALGVKESRKVLELILDVRSRGMPIVLISHNMPHVFEVADRIHIHRLGQAPDGDRSEGIYDVGCRRLHDRRQGSAHGAGCRMTMTIGKSPARCGHAPAIRSAFWSPSPARPAPASPPWPTISPTPCAPSGETAEVLPMDGFHMDNAILIERGLLARKGIPETFDVRGFPRHHSRRQLADQEVLVPVFDRSREIAIASARAVSPDHRFIIVEGNYLLFNQGKWAELDGMFDYSIMLAPPIEVLEERLWARWRGYKLTEEAASAKVYGNDLPNGRLILDNRRPADVTLEIALA